MKQLYTQVKSIYMGEFVAEGSLFELHTVPHKGQRTKDKQRRLASTLCYSGLKCSGVLNVACLKSWRDNQNPAWFDMMYQSADINPPGGINLPSFKLLQSRTNLKTCV